MDIDKTSKLYNLAKVYRAGLKTPFYKELSSFLEKEIELTAKGIIYPGYGTEEHDRIIEARAYKKLLNHCEEKARSYDRLKKVLDDQGINT